jgi:hypothetical protein
MREKPRNQAKERAAMSLRSLCSGALSSAILLGRRSTRIVDKRNVSHRLPIQEIRTYWEQLTFQPFILDDPIVHEAEPYELGKSLEPAAVDKGTGGETHRTDGVPMCPCAPYLVLAEMYMNTVVDRNPPVPNVELFESSLTRLQYETVHLEQQRVKLPLRTRADLYFRNG